MILVTVNEGTLGVPTTSRMRLAHGAAALDADRGRDHRLIEADPSVPAPTSRSGWPNLHQRANRELDACT